MRLKRGSDFAMDDVVETLRAAYGNFNARDIEAVLQRMHTDVDWANGMTGGRVHGQEAVRAYWSQQWETIDPRVEPIGFEQSLDGRWIVSVHQVVHDREGRLLVDRVVEHVYTMESGLIRRMDIRELPQG